MFIYNIKRYPNRFQKGNKTMIKFKVMQVIFIFFAVILSDIMFAHVAFLYSGMLWGIKYAGFSGPAYLVFLFAIPYLIAIAFCLFLAFTLPNKPKAK